MHCIHLVYCSDENYMRPTLVSAASAAIYGDREHKLIFHLIDSGVCDATFFDFKYRLANINPYNEVIRHKWNTHEFDEYPSWHGSRVIYARMVLQDLIPDADWVISLDGDTLWLASPFELLQLRDSRLLFLASEDPSPVDGSELPTVRWFRENGMQVEAKDLYCAGLMLLHLKGLREYNFTCKMHDFLHCFPDPPCPEQMVMSYLCLGRTKPLPKNWGIFSLYHTSIDMSKGGLVHYVSDPPWNRVARIRLISDVVYLWHECAIKTLGLDMRFDSVTRRCWLLKRVLFLAFKFCNTVLSNCGRIGHKCLNARGLPNGIMRNLKRRWCVER